MLAGVERLVDLSGIRTAGWDGPTPDALLQAVQTADIGTIGATNGHFAAASRDGQTVRMARTIGLPLAR